MAYVVVAGSKLIALLNTESESYVEIRVAEEEGMSDLSKRGGRLSRPFTHCAMASPQIALAFLRPDMLALSWNLDWFVFWSSDTADKRKTEEE